MALIRRKYFSPWPERTVGILWPPPSQLFHSDGSPWPKCTPGLPQTSGWTAAACLPGYSGLSAGTHRPSLKPLGSPHCSPPAQTCPNPSRSQLPRQSCAGTATPKGVKSLLAAKTAQPAVHRKGFAVWLPRFQGSGEAESGAPSFPSLPPIHTSSMLLSKSSAQFPHQEE